ncbi:SMC-Scp complex subunit ScpB [Armatimonas rosea]|uniref:Segregation and condensation protein B n=1 Tax=Armatimonas rosea TaxID=685828 RepID=A0A7W9W6Q4_ARMRO|nr:SMC-Scp complex subunit ScpB [Armatimonas rosea]MBB6051679.1 segregation and condensation protein B [Armatimonas rosea]
MRSLLGMVEALLFVSGEPLSLKDLVKATEWDEDAVRDALEELRQRYRDQDSGLRIIELDSGFQLATRPEYGETIGKLLAPHANRLSKPALETLTIVAYRQPATQAEVEAIRGVSCDGVLKTLQERELICEAGRKQTPGRPILYATTNAFLHYFGLTSLDELPALPDDAPTASEQEAAHLSLEAASAL